MVFKYRSWELYGDEGQYVHGRSLGSLPFESGNIGAVYEYGAFRAIHGHVTVPDKVVGKEMFKKFLQRASNLSVKGSSFVRSFDFAMVEEFLILGYGRDERVVGNISTSFSGLANRCVVIVEAGVIFNELHDGSVRSVYTKGCLDGSVHGDPTLF